MLRSRSTQVVKARYGTAVTTNKANSANIANSARVPSARKHVDVGKLLKLLTGTFVEAGYGCTLSALGFFAACF